MTKKSAAALNGELKNLYSSFGYREYRMSGFEEYALYMENKNFLISDKIITFNNLDGRLMALKPDVTLSIVKNATPEKGVGKYYYSEAVYRPDRAGTEFKEVIQTGLEALGDVDAFTTAEAVELALETLSATGAEFVLALSDVRFTEGLLSAAARDESIRAELKDILSKKRAGDIPFAAAKYGFGSDIKLALENVIALPENAFEALDSARRFAFGLEAERAIEELKDIVCAFKGTRFEGNLQIDFSLTGNTRYYNGVLFSGYALGAAGAVLKGGRYDKLVDPAGSAGKGAVGFALYMNEIEKLTAPGSGAADAVLLYPEGAPLSAVMKKADELRLGGLKVSVLPEKSFSGGREKVYIFGEGENA